MNSRVTDPHDGPSVALLRGWFSTVLNGVTLAVVVWAGQTIVEMKVTVATTSAVVQRLEPIITKVKEEQDRRGPIISEHNRFIENYLRYHYDESSSKTKR